MLPRKKDVILLRKIFRILAKDRQDKVGFHHFFIEKDKPHEKGLSFVILVVNQCFEPGYHIFQGESIFLHNEFTWSGGTELVDGKNISLITNIAMPT